MLIKKIAFYDRFEQLKKQVLELCDTVLEHNHISLQYDPMTSDCSWLNSYGVDKTPREKYFNTLQPKLRGTEIELLFNNLSLDIRRTRIFVIDPKSNPYPVHRDPTPRIHIPIETNDRCRFYSHNPREEPAEYMPADGSIYLVDTRINHTFKNESNQRRVHIVGCYYGEDVWS
jgi:hypothetical protein